MKHDPVHMFHEALEKKTSEEFKKREKDPI
jgi:hypothetical protein